MTMMVTEAVVLPPVLLAVTVYDAEVMAEGVPLMAPVKNGTGGGRNRPQVTPLTVGVTVVMAVPLVSVNEFGLYVSDEGAMSLTTMVTVTVSLHRVASRDRVGCGAADDGRCSGDRTGG